MVKKNSDDMLSRFHLIPELTDGRTDGQTDLLYQYRASISRVSMLTRDKNNPLY